MTKRVSRVIASALSAGDETRPLIEVRSFRRLTIVRYVHGRSLCGFWNATADGQLCYTGVQESGSMCRGRLRRESAGQLMRST